MEMLVKKWGNSLATRIPKAVADMIDLKLNQTVSIEAKDGKIIITPIADRKEYTMEGLLGQCSPESLRRDDEDSKWLNEKPVGREW